MSELDEPLVRSNIYHPRMAKTLIGHQKEFLDFVRLMKGGVLPHAWLIAGPLGIGKSTFAWKIAERLILSSVSDKSKKVELKSQIRALSAPGLLVCEKKLDSTGKKKKKFITVDEIRELKNFFSMTSLDSGWRVAIIDSGDDLNSSASNALLKILEEPPLKSIILIVSHTPARLRATIKSRCRIVNLRQLTTESKKEVFSTLGVSYSQLSKSDQTDLKILSGESVGMAINWLNNDGITLFQNCNEIIKGYPNNEKSIRALEQYVDHLARGLSIIVNILDPDIIVLGGGMSNIEFIYETINQELKKYVFSDICHTKIVKNVHGDSGGVRGAAWLS